MCWQTVVKPRLAEQGHWRHQVHPNRQSWATNCRSSNWTRAKVKTSVHNTLGWILWYVYHGTGFVIFPVVICVQSIQFWVTTTSVKLSPLRSKHIQLAYSPENWCHLEYLYSFRLIFVTSKTTLLLLNWCPALPKSARDSPEAIYTKNITRKSELTGVE